MENRPSLIGKRIFNRFRGFICGGDTKVVIDEPKIETTEPKVVIEEPLDDEVFNVIDNYCERSLKLYLNKYNLNRKNKHYYNYTPLIYACYKNITVFIEIILAAGADITISENGFNAFLYACKNNNLKIVKRLVELGANINQKTNNCTVLMAVCNLGYTDIVKFLLECGADTTLKNDLNKIALDYAEKDEIISLFTHPSFNKITKTCNLCRATSNFNILAYHDHDCCICLERKEKIYVYQCGHFNCCVVCFIKAN
jgi:hypothetical protein